MESLQKGCAVKVVRCLSSHEDAAIWIGYEGGVRIVEEKLYGVRLYDVYRRLSHEMHYFQHEEVESVSVVQAASGYISGGK